MLQPNGCSQTLRRANIIIILFGLHADIVFVQVGIQRKVLSKSAWQGVIPALSHSAVEVRLCLSAMPSSQKAVINLLLLLINRPETKFLIRILVIYEVEINQNKGVKSNIK